MLRKHAGKRLPTNAGTGVLRRYMTDQLTTAELVQCSWKAATRSPVLFGTSFYARLFWVAPELRSMFKDDRMAQARKLTETLDFIVANAGQIGSVASEVRDLAISHEGYGVRPEHYEIAGDVLIWTLEHSLGPRFTPAEKAAWVEIYSKVTKVMIDAAYPLR